MTLPRRAPLIILNGNERRPRFRQFFLRRGEFAGSSGQLAGLFQPVSREASLDAGGKVTVRVRPDVRYHVRVYVTNQMSQVDVSEPRELVITGEKTLRFAATDIAAALRHLVR